MSDELKAPYTYTLTDMIGRRADDGRTMIVATFEVQKHHLVIACLVGLPAMVIALVFSTVMGVWAFLIFLGLEVLGFYLIEGRTSDGLQLRRYEYLNDKRVANTGRVFICGREVDPALVEVVNVQGRLLDPAPISPLQALEVDGAEHEEPVASPRPVVTTKPARGRRDKTPTTSELIPAAA